MSIENAFYTRLQAVTAVTDLVGTKIYPAKTENQNPESPYVIYEVLGTDRTSAMGADTGDVKSELRFHVWAQDGATAGFDIAKEVALEVRGALQRFRGTADGVTVQDVFVIDEFFGPTAEPEWTHRIIEFEAHWKE